jgi:hypothetical protein
MRIAVLGVCLVGDNLVKREGRAPFLAIPYSIRELTIIIMRTVFAVAKRAINDITNPPTGPKTTVATALSGATELVISEYGRIPTMDTETKKYRIVVMIIE